MPTPDQVAARQAMKKLEQDAKHNPPPGGDPVSDAGTTVDDVNDPKHQGQAKQDPRWKQVDAEVWSHPDFDQS